MPNRSTGWQRIKRFALRERSFLRRCLAHAARYGRWDTECTEERRGHRAAPRTPVVVVRRGDSREFRGRRCDAGDVGSGSPTRPSVGGGRGLCVLRVFSVNSVVNLSVPFGRGRSCPQPAGGVKPLPAEARSFLHRCLAHAARIRSMGRRAHRGTQRPQSRSPHFGRCGVRGDEIGCVRRG